MKKLTSSRLPRLVLVLGAALLTSSACAELIGHWQFDEGSGTVAVDSAGSHPGTLNGGVSYIPGKIGPGALQFDGASGYVEVGGVNSALELVGTPYTIAFYVKYEGGRRMINMDDGDDYSGGYSVYFQKGALRWSQNNGANQTWTASGIAPATTWQHFALVWDGANRLIYRDGTLVLTKATAGHLTSDHDDPLRFGAIPVYGQYFKGALDDIRIYNAALSASEVTDLVTPQILVSRQPASVVLREPTADAVFSVTANVSNNTYPAAELQYQWQKDGTDLPGATASVLALSNLTTLDSGAVYKVVISHANIAETKTSAEATLVVLPADPSPVLIGHWTFNEQSGTVALDSAGTNDGQIFNAEYVPGCLGSALQFNGTNSHVEVGGIGTALQLVDTPYSILWWQKWGGPTGQHQRIINMDDGDDYSGGYAIYLHRGTKTLGFTHNIGDTTGQTWDSGFTPSANWDHCALVWDGKLRTFYVNGVAVGAVPTTEGLSSDGDDPLWFGGIPVYGQYFNGALDDIRIYEGAFAANEIAAFVPHLLISRGAEGQILISWPVSSAGYILQVSDLLGSNALWSPEAQAPETQNGTNILTLVDPVGTKFYRLGQP